MHVEIVGRGPRLVLVHGSVTPGWMTWNAQKPLASQFTLVVPIRTGYPPNPPLAAIDFEEQARELSELLQPGDHLVGHSYGAVVSLLAAVGSPLSSLTVLEPPALGVARSHSAVERFIADFKGAPNEPRAYLEFFLPLVGSALVISEALPPTLEAGARAAVAERSPDQATIPLDELAATDFPKLVVSGGHNAAFDAVCDVLEERLGAERAVVSGAGHSIPGAAGFNEVLVDFLTRSGGHTGAQAVPK
jgi:pimeloyl-ACP methyl ester carboxylesterase